MGADYRKTDSSRRPREYYGPRKLVAANSNSTKQQFYGKSAIASANDNANNDNAKDESLPRGWSILEPNRVKERRLAAGYETADQLALKIATMSYARLHKIESGLVVVRDSEYELIAKVLGIPVHHLQLPMLMHSETVQWMEIWGKEDRLEEGGDHDAVILAAYVRYHAERRQLNKATICANAKVPTNAMHFIWHAAKPIDRYPDTTMMATMMLTENSSWDNVIKDSRGYYAAGMLIDQVKKVQAPRVRYAPEDPDKRAPWTYDVDPFREHQPRSQYVNAYTSEGTRATPTKIKDLTERRSRTKRLIQFYNDAKLIHRIAMRDKDPRATLLEYHPHEHKAIAKIETEEAARITLHRLMCIKYLQANADMIATPFSVMLGVSAERIRQMKADEVRRGLVALIPHRGLKSEVKEPRWSDYRHNCLLKAA